MIKNQLMKLNRYRDYQNGYQRIKNVRRSFGLSERSWDDLINGSKSIPLDVYARVYSFVRKLKPVHDTDRSQMDIALDNLKRDLSRNKRVCVN